VVSIRSVLSAAAARKSPRRSRLNRQLNEENRPYLLIGVGRWGSTEPWLGIPGGVGRNQRRARHCRSGIPRLPSHAVARQPFFQNLTAFQIGYFHCESRRRRRLGRLALAERAPSVEEQGCVRHLHFANRIVVMNSRTSQGVIFKPKVQPATARAASSSFHAARMTPTVVVVCALHAASFPMSAGRLADHRNESRSRIPFARRAQGSCQVGTSCPPSR